MEPKVYEELLKNGWRRSGYSFYLNQCPECDLCIPIRIPIDQFIPSKSQKRTVKKNKNVSIIVEPVGFRRDIFDLYKKYNTARHDPKKEIQELDYMNFLGASPVETRMMLYYIHDKLIGTGWIDILSTGISSVYYAFDPDFSSRSLGTFSVIQEIEMCRSFGFPYYYLGFWVPGSPKMDYKEKFRPNEIFIQGNWENADSFRFSNSRSNPN